MNTAQPHISFQFKRFSITDSRCGLRLGTDGVLLGAWARLPYAQARLGVDIGTGCGIVALMLAQRFPELKIDAVEINPGACIDAEFNFESSPWRDRLRLIKSSFSTYPGPPDMIVSNPPFFTSGELSPDPDRADARHASELSPLALIDYSASILPPSGTLSLIVPAEMEDDLICRAAFSRLYPRRICRVSSVRGKKPIRLLCEFSTSDGDIEYSSLTIRDADGSYTPDFRSLSGDFYLKL